MRPLIAIKSLQLMTALRMLRGYYGWARQVATRLRRNAETKTLLLVYDLASQPFSIGDILILQEAALVQCESLGISKVDVAIVYDAAAPVVRDPAFSHIRPENFLVHLSSVLPAAQVNPYLGSLLLFDTHDKLEKYVIDNLASYTVWPPLASYATKQYLFYDCLDRVLLPFYNRFKRIPCLRSRPVMAEWAAKFIARHAEDRVAVSLQLRNNPATPLRNSDYPSWQKFLEECAKKYRATFFVICAHHEVFSDMRSLSNVVIAKDHYTTLEQDLALIEACSMHMGPSSGPGTMAMFSSKPYCMFSADLHSELLTSLVEEDGRFHFKFSMPNQTWIRAKENYEIISDEFAKLWTAVMANTI